MKLVAISYQCNLCPNTINHSEIGPTNSLDFESTTGELFPANAVKKRS